MALLPSSEALSCPAECPIEQIEDSDIIFVQTELWDHSERLTQARKQAPNRFHPLPVFYFPAFHPDIIIETMTSGGMLLSPAGQLNSSIILYGYINELNIAQTIGLFTDPVFDRLGFYDYWEESKIASISNLQECGLEGNLIFEKWAVQGCFAYSVNQPKISAIGIAAEALIKRIGLTPLAFEQCDTPADPLEIHGSWPVYPEIAKRLNCEGGYDFKYGAPLPGERLKTAIDLETFVRLSYDMYSQIPRDQIRGERLLRQAGRYANLEALVRKPGVRREHVYSNLPAHCYWADSVGNLNSSSIDPVVNPKFTLSAEQRIATGGSCFAQHIAKTLVANNFNYYVAEQPPAGKTPAWASKRAFGLFSARYGNIYTARQLYQLVQRACGKFDPVDSAWCRGDGRYVDPFRPQIEPDGYATAQEVFDEATRHLAFVKDMLQSVHVFVFTPGLTECWASKIDGAVFPVAPGVIAGEMDPHRYEFLNFRTPEVKADLIAAIDLMRVLNPEIKFIFTVSPVPLVATYENRHVLVSTAYSKSVLRASIDETVQQYDFADYFPSYELITGHFNGGRYFEKDKRSVSQEGIDQVMGLFRKHYFQPQGRVAETETAPAPSYRNDPRAEIASNAPILCDEELHHYFGPMADEPHLKGNFSQEAGQDTNVPATAALAGAPPELSPVVDVTGKDRLAFLGRLLRHFGPKADQPSRNGRNAQKTTAGTALPVAKAKNAAPPVLSPNVGVMGTDGWVFLGNMHQHEYDQVTGRFKVSSGHIEEWVEVHSLISKFAKRRNISLLFVVAPSKGSIYPDKLPLRDMPDTKWSSTFERLILRASETEFPLLDLRPALIAARAQADTYSPLNSHWTDFGAWAAWREIARALHQCFPHTEFNSGAKLLNIETIDACNEAKYLMGIDGPNPWTRAVLADALPSYSMILSDKTHSLQNGSRTIDLTELPAQTGNKAASTKHRALILMDSVGCQIAPYLYASFESTFQYRHHVSQDQAAFNLPGYVSRHNPDVILYFMTERYAIYPLGALDYWRALEAFELAPETSELKWPSANSEQQLGYDGDTSIDYPTSVDLRSAVACGAVTRPLKLCVVGRGQGSILISYTEHGEIKQQRFGFGPGWNEIYMQLPGEVEDEHCCLIRDLKGADVSIVQIALRHETSDLHQGNQT